MQNLLLQCAPTEYASWKVQRHALIKQLKSYLLSLPEKEIVSFYSYLENEIQRMISSGNSSNMLQCLHSCSILYHFQRNHDSICSFFSTFASKLETIDRTIANAIAKAFYWLAEDSNEANQAFREPLNSAKFWIKEKPDLIFNSLVVFKRIRKFLPSDLIQIIFNNFSMFLKIASDEDSQCQELTMTLLKFLFSQVSEEDFQSKIPLFFDHAQVFLESKKNHEFYCSIRFFNFLINLKSFSNCPDIIKIVLSFSRIQTQQESNQKIQISENSKEKITQQESNKSRENDDYLLNMKILRYIIKLALKVEKRFHNPIDDNLFTLFCQYFESMKLNNPIKTYQKLVSVFKGKYKLDIFVDFITNLIAENKMCQKGKICPFKLLHIFLNTHKNEDVNIVIGDNIVVCKHFLKCAMLKKEVFLTEKVRSYFLSHINSNDPEYINYIRVFQFFPEFLPEDRESFINQLHSILISSNNVELRKQILKTLKLMNCEKSNEIIFFGSLIDPDESIRLFCMRNLEPTPYLSTHANIVQYLNDSSFLIRREGIKLISKICDYNPLEIQPLIVDYLQTLFEIIITSSNVEDSSNYAAFLSTITKHCREISTICGYNIISVALKVINSSVPDNERKAIYYCSNINSSNNNNFSKINCSQILKKNEDSDKNDEEESSPSTSSISKIEFNQNSNIPPYMSNVIGGNSAIFEGVNKISPSIMNSPRSPLFPSSESINSFYVLSSSDAERGGDCDFFSQRNMSITKNGNNGRFTSKYSLDSLKMPLLLMNEKKSLKEPNRAKLFLTFHSKYIDKRDAYLLKAISNLGSFCQPFLIEILASYCHIFETRTRDELLISAVNSLTKLSLFMYNGLNIRLRCPKMAAPLVHILSTTSNKILAISIIQLFGSAFDSVDILLTQSLSATNELSAVMTNSPSFYTDLSIRNIVKYLGDPCLIAVKTLTLIVEGDPIYSAKYLPQIASVFVHLLKKGSVQVKNQTFQHLGIVACNCIKDFVPLLPIFLPLIKYYLDLESCIRFATLLSFFFKAEFISCANELYFKAISALNVSETTTYRSLANFLTSMIVNQHLPFDIFLRTIEKQNFLSNPQTIQPTIQALTSVIQSVDISTYSSRLIIFATKVFLISKIKVELSDFFASLCLYGNCKVSHMKKFYESNHLTYKHFDELSNAVEKTTNLHISRNKYKFLKDMRIKFPIPRSYLKLQTTHYFTDIEYPNELHIHIWINNLQKIMITKSPSTSIRACSDFLTVRMRLISKLFPVAFISCWKKADIADREYFSTQIIDRALHEHRNVHHIFFDIINFANKSLIPMNVDLIKVAELSSSHQNTLFLLQKKYICDQQNKEINKMMINTCVKMGRLATARGLLKKIELKMDIMDIAKWSGELGDWEKALDIYRSQNAGLPLILKCLEAMNKYDEILEYEAEYHKLPEKEKIKVMDHFLWAFQLINEYEKVEEIIQNFDNNNWTQFRLIFTIYVKITTGEYQKAQELIDLAYLKLATHKSEYAAGDQNQVECDQNTAEILVESQEVLKFKLLKSATEQTTSFFMRRVKHFKRTRFIWERTICLRQIVVPIDEVNLGFYLKIISELRKAHFFSLIDHYFGYHLKYKEDTSFIVESIKILWEREKKLEALELSQKICDCLNITEDEDFLEAAKDVSPIYLSQLLYKITKVPELFSLDLEKFLLDSTKTCSLSSFWKLFEELPTNKQINIYHNFVDNFPNQVSNCLRFISERESKNTHFITSINMLTGKYICSLKPDSFDSIERASQYFRTALKEVPMTDNIKIWRSWAHVNSKLFSLAKYLNTNSKVYGYPNNDPNSNANSNANINADINSNTEMNIGADLYAKRAVKSFLKLCQLQQNDSLEYASQLFSILCSSNVADHFVSDVTDLSPSIVIKALPLITSKIDHSDPNVQQIICSILTNTGLEYFQEIFFALNVYLKSSDKKRSQIAKQIIQKISKVHVEKARDLEIFVDGMVRGAMTWFELWMHSLEQAVKMESKDESSKILSKRFSEFLTPKCELDLLFVRLYKDIIESCIRHFEHQDDEKCFALLWSKLRSLYSSLKDRVNKLSVIFLSKISEDLVTKKNFAIFAPGYNDYTIESIEPIMEVLETQQHPRVLFLNTSHGKKYKYLLKGNEDLRLDERLMQLFALINGILNHKSSTKENNAFISRYAVIPLTKTVGLIKWVSGADTFHQLVIENREISKIDKDFESLYVKKKTNVNIGFISLNSIQRLEIFERVSKKTNAAELFEAMWLKAPNAAVWMTRTQRFTISYALMAMVGYVIGLGDRHPCNIMVQRETGNIVHIDFGESFDAAVLRPLHPEKVPFRLTRMVKNALEGGVETGLFREFASEVMTILRENKASLMAQLTIFVEEPLSHFKKMAIKTKDVSAMRDSVLIEKCAKKLDGMENGKIMEVKNQVDELIRAAVDPTNYVRHYPGWCPFW